MVEITCKYSGLRFEAKTLRTKVHPEIAKYTTYQKDHSLKFQAREIVEAGKEKGWSLDQFLEALNTSEEVESQDGQEQPSGFEIHATAPGRRSNHQKSPWASKLTGYSEKYRFERKFLESKRSEGRDYFFEIEEEGIYQVCSYSSKGNKESRFGRFEKDNWTIMDKEEVEEIFPIPQENTLSSSPDCVQTEEYLGKVFDLVKHNNSVWKVVKVEKTLHWEDEDGVAGTGTYLGDTRLVDEYFTHKTFLFPATPEEIATFEEQEHAQAKQERKQLEQEKASARLTEIYKEVPKFPEKRSPENTPFPSGRRYIVSHGHYQPNNLFVVDGDRVWVLTYNNRDNDDWSLNNVGGTHFGCYVNSSSLAEEVLGLIETVEKE